MDEEMMAGLEQEETTEQQDTGIEAADGQLALGADGTLVIPDSFFDDLGMDTGEAPAEAAPTAETPEAQEQTAPATPPAPQPYTPEELAEAFASGNVDTGRLQPELAAYYNAVTSRMQQRADAERIQAELAGQSRQNVVPVQQGVQPAIGSVEQWKQLSEAAKVLAAQNYLGIAPDEFDEFDPQHAAARNMAMQEIRDRAQSIMHQQAAQQASQQQRVAAVADTYAAYRQTVPEIDEIGEKYFPIWRENLSMREYRAVDEILQSGDPAKLKGLLDRLVSDYRENRVGTPRPAGSAPRRAPNPQKAPPMVLSSAGGDEDEDSAGMVDVSDFGRMTPEEQAAFLVANKFTG